MKIKKVAAVNFEGNSFNQPLGPVTLIVGDNRSGKTSHTNAVRAAMYGLLPRLGKMATPLLASGPVASACITFDDNRVNSVEWTTDAKGSVKTVPVQAHRFPPILADFGEWVKLTVQEKVAAAFSTGYCEGDWDDAMVRENLRQIGVAAPVDVAQRVVNEVVREWDQRVHHRNEGGGDVPPWLDGTITLFKEKAKAAGQSTKTLQAQVAGATPGPKPADVSSKLDEAQAKLSAANQAVGAARQAAEQSAKESEKLEQLKADAGNLKQAQANAQATANAAADILAKIAKLEKAERLETVIALQDQQRDMRSKATLEKSKATAELEKLDRIATRVLKADKCPCCQVEGTEWKARWQKSHDESVAKEKAIIAQADKVISECTATETMLCSREEDARKNGVALNHLRSDYAMANRKAAEALAQNERCVRAKNDFAAHKKEAKALPDVAKAEMEQAQAEETVRELREKDAVFADWAVRKERAAKLEADAILAAAQQAAWKAAVEAVTFAQRCVLDNVFGRLLNLANEFTKGFMPAIEWRDDFGYERDGQWVSHRTFSGTEELIAYAGLCVALAKGAPVRIVMLDELGRLSKPNRVKLVARLAQLVATNTIDQAIAIDTESDWLTPALTKQVAVVKL